MKQLRTQKRLVYLSIMLILVLCATAIRPAIVATASDGTDTQAFLTAARSFAEQAEAAGGHHLTAEPVITVTSKQIQAGKMEVTMEIDAMSVLNSGPRDAEPVLAGKLQYLQDHGTTLSAAAKKAVEDDIADWRSTIESAMTVPSEGCFSIKVVADVRIAGNIDTNTLQVYVDNGPMQSNFIPAAQFLKDVRSGWATVTEAYDSSASIASAASAKGAVAPAATSSSYNRTIAYQYADRWAKDTTIHCDSATLQNTANWNNIQYPNYQSFYCNDCADYVSQCLHAGGIPTTAMWSYCTNNWDRAGPLMGYLKDNGYITYVASRLDCKCGDPFFFEDKDQWGNPNGVISHTVFMAYNDGKYTYYDAHTSDHLRFFWDGTYSLYFYHYTHVIY
ncbi:amidase domain-containing protein [Candidatus Cryosericum odellii]|jgi:hypothetical protein|nr:amidase domain-containing protein [Candidatus Cryosericum odellii]